MSILKCIKCNKEFNTKFINTSEVLGLDNINGKLKVYPIWPFQISLKAQCPNCNEEGKMIVLVNKKTKIVTIILVLIILILIFLF